jgi:hypothetical protein
LSKEYDGKPLFKQDHVKYYNGQSVPISEETIELAKKLIKIYWNERRFNGL